jgi:hypothetical protein
LKNEIKNFYPSENIARLGTLKERNWSKMRPHKCSFIVTRFYINFGFCFLCKDFIFFISQALCAQNGWLLGHDPMSFFFCFLFSSSFCQLWLLLLSVNSDYFFFLSSLFFFLFFSSFFSNLGFSRTFVLIVFSPKENENENKSE